MKDAIGIAAVLLIGVVLYSVSQLPPSVAEVKAARAAVCEGRGRPITVNGKVAACSDDPKTWTVYTPDGDPRDVVLVTLSKKTQDWIDAP